MKSTPIIIDWNYSGTPDGFFGTGATKAEQATVWFFGLLGTALLVWVCLLYTSDAADERSSVDLGGRSIIKKKIRVNTLYLTFLYKNKMQSWTH